MNNIETKTYSQSDRFNDLLKEYQDVYAQYTNSISNADTYRRIVNYLFVGNTVLNTVKDSSDVDACETLCKTNSQCTGAAYDLNRKTCTISNGYSDIVERSGITSIVKDRAYYYNKLKQLNQELTNMLINMTFNAKNNNEKYNYNEAELKQNYDMLIEDRSNIDNIVADYTRFNGILTDTQLDVDKNYMRYILLIIAVVILGFIIFKLSVIDSVVSAISLGNEESQMGGSSKRRMIIDFVKLFTLVLGGYILFQSFFE
jgi:hypothetical protein